MSWLLAIRIVFGERMYLAILFAVSVSFFVVFSILDEYLFFSPFVVFNVPKDGYANFSLSIAIVILLGFVISMNVYMFRSLGAKLKKSTPWLSGCLVATATGVCGCSSLGFTILSSLGGAGVLASSVVTNYQIPLRVASLALIVFAYYSINKSIRKSCLLK